MKPPRHVVGIVGAGAIARQHLPAYLGLGHTVFVYSEVGSEDITRDLGGTPLQSFDELVNKVDIVDVCTPTDTHFSLIERALQSGKDVISEKPLARSSREADSLASLATELGRRVFPAHVVRYFPEYASLANAVHTGLIGDLAVLRFSRSSAFPLGSSWYKDHAKSGGIIMDLMIHDIDVAIWIAGEVSTVSASGAFVQSEDAPIEAAHVLLTHESGAITHVAGVWGPQSVEFVTEYSVTGTKGKLEYRSDLELGYRSKLDLDRAGGEFTPPTDPAESPYLLEITDFLSAIDSSSDARVSVHDGAYAVRIAEAAARSVASGQPVSLRAEG